MLQTTLSVSRISDFQSYQQYLLDHPEKDLEISRFEQQVLEQSGVDPGAEFEFPYPGHCYACSLDVDLLMDHQFSYQVGEALMLNWRERLDCPHCRLNNRMRAIIHLFAQECQPSKDSRIYLTEQVSPLFQWFDNHYDNLTGSEFIRGFEPGECNAMGVRNEDLTQLSFDDDEFEFILSFDVFEHVPTYQKGLAECFRCLQPGGALFFSIPFVKHFEQNQLRARIREDGAIDHLQPAVYHHDPLDPDGCLCFHDFGWQILDDLRAVGFERANGILYWSREFGYLGGEQPVFCAWKPNR